MEESKKNFDLIVSEGKLPLWKAIISSALITLSISIIFYTFHKIYQVGFNNRSYFSLRFKEEFGCNPNEYEVEE